MASSIRTAVTPPPIEFDTQRLAFRVWGDRHRAPFAAMNMDPQVMRFFPAPSSPAQSNAAIDFWLGQFAVQGWSNWAVELRSTGEFLGFIGLSVPRRQLPFTYRPPHVGPHRNHDCCPH